MTTLTEAKQRFGEAIRGEGMDCPCCGRWGKINPYQITSTQAKGLIWMFTNFPRDYWIDLGRAPEWILRSKPMATAKWWGLVEPAAKEEKDADKKASGKWRLTDKGRAFVLGRTLIPKYAFIFDNGCFGYSSDMVDIRDALKKKFSYEELMGNTMQRLA